MYLYGQFKLTFGNDSNKLIKFYYYICEIKGLNEIRTHDSTSNYEFFVSL